MRPKSVLFERFGRMPKVELSEETARKLKAFSKIMGAILAPEDVPETEAQSAELVISIGLERMLLDVLPKGENGALKAEIFHNTMTQMFDRNPEFVCEFVSDMVRRGEVEEQKKRTEEARRRWGLPA